VTVRVHVDLDDLDELVRVLTGVVDDLPAITTDLGAALAEAGIAFGIDPAADVLRPRFADAGRMALDALGAVEAVMREHIMRVDAAGEWLRTADICAKPLAGTRGEGLSQ
jgi:hypothetical protein